MSDDSEGAPAWMISFGDMMTLILTFFILLVSMSRTQQVGLIAQGVGSFMLAVRSFGLPAMMSETEQAMFFDSVRQRFNLPPEEDAERRTDHEDASNMELIRAKVANALRPHDEINQPAIAVFEAGSAELSPEGGTYIDLLATTLKPGPGQVLQLEGHSQPGEHPSGRYLAYARAQAVRAYLIEQHSFPPTRTEARAWVEEIDSSPASQRTVDARLILPAKEEN